MKPHGILRAACTGLEVALAARTSHLEVMRELPVFLTNGSYSPWSTHEKCRL